MKIIFYLLPLLVLLSCSQNQKADNLSIEVISINLDKKENKEMSEFIEKIELVPLHTDTNSIISTYKKIDYCDELDMFIILDKELVVSLFSGDGQFIANSKNVIGEGPNEYRTAVDVIYNPFSRAIEILNPYGTIYRYNTSFQFIEKISLEQNSKIFSRFVSISNNEYILTPVMSGYKDATIVFCNYNKKKIIKSISYEEDCISSITMNYNPFFTSNNNLIFSPLCLNYSFYQVDRVNQDISPIIKLDFGDNTIQKESLVEKFGNSSQENENREDIERNLKTLNDINSFLLKSSASIPIIKFFNEQYIYTYSIQNNNRISYIYNRKNKQSYMQTNNSQTKLIFCLGINNNCLYSAIQPYELEEYVDKNLLHADYQSIVSKINDEDNPIIVKYYLK